MRIAPSSYLLLVPGQGPYLRLVGLTQALTPGSSVEVTFTFAEAITVTVTVPFGLPTAPVPRTSADVPDEASE
jgi:copper(I)-binding protein